MAEEQKSKPLGAGYINGKPDVTYWMKNVRKGVQFRKKRAYQDQWDLWRKYYRGQWDPKIMPYNIFFKMLRTLVPRVYFRNPSISVRPGKPGIEYAILAQIVERLDNKLIHKMGLKGEMKRMIQDAFLFGTGIGKLGYGAEFTPSPELLDTQDPRDKRGRRLEYNDVVQPNTPWFLRVPTGHFIVPDGCAELRSARWAAHWIQRHVDDVRSDPRLSNTTTLEPTAKGHREWERDGKQSAEGMVDLIEIRDKKTGKCMVLFPYGDEGKRVGYFEDDELQFEGRLPYRSLIFNEDDEFFWGIPDAQILDPLQREKNETRTLIMKHRRLSLIKFVMERGTMLPDEAAKLIDTSEVGGVAVTEKDPSLIKELTIGDIPAGLLKADALADKDIQEILGLGQNQWGEYMQGSEKPSATEASIVNAASQIRTDERRDICADLLVDVAKDINNVVFDRWDGNHVVDILGPMGVKIWIQFTPELLRQGAYELDIDPDSSVPETRQVREAKAIQTYTLLKDNPLINPIKLTGFLLRELHGYQYDDLMVDQAQAQLIPGMTPQNPITLQQYAGVLPQLQQIAGAAAMPRNPAALPAPPVKK